MNPEVTFSGPRMQVRYVGKPTQLLSYDITLGPERNWARVRLTLPTDLTQQEAERLKRIIDTLVMPEEEAA